MMLQPLSQSPVTSFSIRTEPSLYRRLGGYDVIAAIVNSVMERLREDPRFAIGTGGGNPEARQRALRHLVGQMCELSGGPCIYIENGGKFPRPRPGLTERDWKATRKHMARTLSELRVARKESEEVIALWTRHREEILESAAAG